MSFEGGNYHNATEGQEQGDTIGQPLEETQLVVEQTQGGVESIEADVDRQQQVDATLERFAGLAEQQGFQGFDVFQSFILNTTAENQNLFVDRSNIMQVFNTVRDSGRFPVNEFEFQQSLIEGTFLQEVTEVRQEVTEVRQEETKVQQEVAEENRDSELLLSDLRNFGDSISNLSISNPLLIQLISSLPDHINDANRDQVNESGLQITAILRSTRLIEKEILPQAYAQGPEAFKEVSKNLVSLDGNFKSRIESWELGKKTGFSNLPGEPKIRVSAALGTDIDGVKNNAEQSGNIFTIRSADGMEVNYDVVKNERSLELDGYSLSSQVEDTGDYQTPKLDYMRVEQSVLPQIKIIENISQALTDKEVKTEELAEIKATIATIPGVSSLGIDFNSFSSGEEIQSALSTLLQKHQSDLGEAREEYRDELLKLRDGHMAALAKKDKKVKETLSFFESIGFTEIPQYITDQIVETLNSNTALAAQLGFTEKINFSNGELGIDTIAGEGETIDLQDKKAFAEFVNKMLGVDAINVGIIGSGAPVGDRNKFKTQLRESGLLDVGGIGVAMENLTQTEDERILKKI